MADNTIGHMRVEIHITPSDLGRRVSVRRILETREGRPVFGDVVGLLTSWDNGVLVVQNKSGAEVMIAESAMVAAKAVPPAPVRRGRGALAAHLAVGVDELVRISARSWPAPETAALGGWTLRAASGFTRRANSVLPVGDPDRPLGQALAAATAWYDRHGLPTYVQVCSEDRELDAELAARGWTVEAAALVRTAPLAPVVDAVAAPERAAPAAGGVLLSRELGPAWLARYHRAVDPAKLPAASAVLSGGPSVWFATVPGPDGAEPAAIGRCVVDGRWAGFAAVEVAQEQRRRGLATQVMAALARAAAGEGADLAYLQVEPENSGALALYDRLGFADHHGYHYRRGPRG
jgi:ribosomal protein S18 acetylase RimI-like enzyme